MLELAKIPGYLKLLESRKKRLLKRKNKILEEIELYNTVLRIADTKTENAPERSEPSESPAQPDGIITKDAFNNVGRSRRKQEKFKKGCIARFCQTALEAAGRPMHLDDMIEKGKALGYNGEQKMSILRDRVMGSDKNLPGIINHFGNGWYGLAGRDTQEDFNRRMAAGELKRASEQLTAVTESTPPENQQPSQASQPADPMPAVMDSPVSQAQHYPDI